MNFIKRLLTRKKTFTADEWKRGLQIGAYFNDAGTKNPFKDSSLVYVAASKISENLPQAPLEFFSMPNKTRLGLESPIVRLFMRPSDIHTYFTFFEECTLFLALYGETFIWIGESMGQKAGLSTIPGQLQPLNPTRMQEVIDDGRLVGWTYDNGRERVALNTDEVLQIKFPNPYNMYRGLAPIDSARTDVDSDYLAGKYSKAFFQNGANPGLLFTLDTDDESSDDQRRAFLKEWNKLHKGASKQYKAAVLNPGMDVKKTGLTQEEMDYIKQRNFNTERVLSVFGVPPPMAGFYEQATYGNVRTAKKIFWNETIKAYARRYESSLNNFFLPRFAPGTVCFFNFSQIDELKHDAKETADIVNIYANHGVPMNVLIESFELPFGPQDKLDVGYQPMTSLEVGTNFIEEQRGDGVGTKETVNTVPSIFNEFEKNLHNYLFTQRKKILKMVGKGENITNFFWKQENDRLIAKFDPIYVKYSKNMDNLLKINNLNRKLVKNLKSDEIKDLYNKFDKKLGNNEMSRVSMISLEETKDFPEQTIIGDHTDE
jgi:HK97 family phage portal protein